MRNEYNEFIKKHFPYSSCNENESIELLYARVCENNLVTEVYEKYILAEECGINYHFIFLQKYRNQLNKLLLYLPLNEPSGINFCMRATIENLIKFLYSIYFRVDLQSVTRCKFRHIREGLSGVETESYIDKVKMNILFNFYGNFSNSIHDKVEDQEFQLEYMESIIETCAFGLVELEAKVVTMLNIYESLICNIFEIKEETLSSSDILRLKKSLSSNRFKKVVNNLYKNE